MKTMTIKLEAGKPAPDKIILERTGKTYIDRYIYWNDSGRATREKR